MATMIEGFDPSQECWEVIPGPKQGQTVFRLRTPSRVVISYAVFSILNLQLIAYEIRHRLQLSYHIDVFSEMPMN